MKHRSRALCSRFPAALLVLAACAPEPAARPRRVELPDRTAAEDAGDGADAGPDRAPEPIVDAGVPSCAGRVTRLAGTSRFETAVAVSRWKYADGAPAAVLVRADDVSPDAAPGASLAVKAGGPLLLTQKEALSPATADELARLKVTKVFLVGGEAAISAAVEATLAASYAVERIAGANRFETAATIADRVGAPRGLSFVVSGDDAHLIDGLFAASAAAGLGAPTLFVTSTEVPAATSARLDALGVTKTWVIGGPEAIPDAVMSQLPAPERIAGNLRYDTAAAVASRAVRDGLKAEHVLVAGGVGVDAVAASASGAPLLMSTADKLWPAAAAFLYAHARSAALIGGDEALGPMLPAEICEALKR